jgi:BASS family bile acid:Na+ symporter
VLPIDEVRLNFDPVTLNILNAILGFIVFGVSLDIKVEDFSKIARSPRPFLVGAFSQFFLFPAITFSILCIWKPIPSIALGMILVAACPGGNISNFMTQLGRGNAALSISMSAFSTALATVMTPFNIAFWGSRMHGTDSIMQSVALDPYEMFFLILVLMLIPLTLGITIAHRFPVFANKLKKWMKLLSITFFALFVIFAIIANFNYMVDYIGLIAILVVFLNAVAFAIGYGFAGLFRLKEYDRRAVSIETGIQNSGLGLILIFNFFDGLGGMAMIAAFWGVWHILSGLALATYWNKKDMNT